MPVLDWFRYQSINSFINFAKTQHNKLFKNHFLTKNKEFNGEKMFDVNAYQLYVSTRLVSLLINQFVYRSC